MEDGFLAAPEAGVSVETWKQKSCHAHKSEQFTVSYSIYNDIVLE